MDEDNAAPLGHKGKWYQVRTDGPAGEVQAQFCVLNVQGVERDLGGLFAGTWRLVDDVFPTHEAAREAAKAAARDAIDRD